MNIGKVRIGLLLMWLLVLLFLTLAGSCTETEVEEGGTPPYALREVEAGFKLNVQANQTPVTRSMIFTPDGAAAADTLSVAAADTVKTKAADPLGDESQIADLWVGQYNAETGALLSGHYISSVNDNEVKLKLTQNGTTISHLYFIANAGNLGETSADAITTESLLNAHVMPYASSEAGLPETGLCKMAGKWEGVVVSGGVEAGVTLIRLLARITFTYSVGGEGFSYSPTSVTLNSVPESSRVGIPSDQLPGISYTTYVGIADRPEATMYWYLPENMAGTATEDAAVTSEKQKTGVGVSDATYIEMTGDAVQNGVAYRNVSFRFYPGRDMNNYNIKRNSHYIINVTLVGIDLSDKRITVGEISSIAPVRMDAEKGSVVTTQITARPSQAWAFIMPGWLSALMDGDREIAADATISHEGPANLLFRAETANPEAEERTVSIPAGYTVNEIEQAITIIQSGSTLTTGGNISLGAVSGSEGSSTFTATRGLRWQAIPDAGSWLGWSVNNAASTGEATGEGQELRVRAVSCNPLASPRTGVVTVGAGASIGNTDYTGLRRVIVVQQAASTVSSSTVTMNAEAANGQSSFLATAGLPWSARVTSGDWISLSSNTGGQTNGTNQNLSFSVPVNPSSGNRSGTITVRAGDTSRGPEGRITINQRGSSFSVSSTTLPLSYTEDALGTVDVTGTKGLRWTIERISGDANIKANITGSLTTGDKQTVTFKAPANTGSARSATFRIAVPGGNHSKTVTVNQGGVVSYFDFIIRQEVLDNLSFITTDFINYPPFDAERINQLPKYPGCSFNGTKMTGSYRIQIQRKQNYGAVTFLSAKKYCSDLVEDGRSDWRLPTLIESRAIWVMKNKMASGTHGCSPLASWGWTSSVPTLAPHSFLIVHFDQEQGAFTLADSFMSYGHVRCVRDDN